MKKKNNGDAFEKLNFFLFDALLCQDMVKLIESREREVTETVTLADHLEQVRNAT